MNYPSPCDTCENVEGNCIGCEKWRIRFLWYWKRCNSYVKRVNNRNKKKSEKFIYEHPDIIRRYLQNGPCEYCKISEECNTPCPVYWGWWDVKMELLRGKMQKIHKTTEGI